MHRIIVAIFLPAIMLLTACGNQSQPTLGLSTDATMGPTTNKAIPPLTAENSTIDCSGWSDGAKTYLRQQGLITINEAIYGVGTFACGVPDSEFGSEFVESFLFTEGIWAANGLVAGPDLPISTSGECNSGAEIICPAVVLSPDPEIFTEGNLVIFEQDGGLSWRFDAK